MKLSLSHIKKSFESKEVLKDIDFQFESGKIYGLLGRNGAGKTTLFNCLSGETELTEGQACLLEEGTPLPLTMKEIGYVYSTPILPEFLTGYEFIRFFMDINQDPAIQGASPEEYLAMLDLKPDDWHRLIKGYSHGMKNKLQMLCFIIARPPVILLDEPLTSLDVVVALEIKKLLQDIKKDRIILFSTHILQLATDLCDEIVVLNDGRLEQVDHAMLGSSQFEENIIKMLSEEEPSSEKTEKDNLL